jgi:CubicO group peptidase (beta-lactamase class C family)
MPMATDAIFWIASQSKPITPTALMMLVDEGKLALDDLVEKHLPEFHHQWLAVEQDSNHVLLKHPKRPITVRDILSHTSGLPFASAAERPTLDLLPLRVGVLTYAISPLQFEPGSKYQYSNAGTNTAGRIIEVKGSMTYEDFLENRLSRPLGMNDTTFWPDSEQVSRLARSYKPGKNKNGLEETIISQLKYPLNDRTRQPMPAGGLFSTARDLARFCQMILNEGVFEGKRYLSRAAVAELTRSRLPIHQRELRPGLVSQRPLLRPRRCLFDRHDDRPRSGSNLRLPGPACWFPRQRRHELRGLQEGRGKGIRHEGTVSKSIPREHGHLTCALPVKLQPGKIYATWINSVRFTGFKDREFGPVIPYLLIFRTRR